MARVHVTTIVPASCKELDIGQVLIKHLLKAGIMDRCQPNPFYRTEEDPTSFLWLLKHTQATVCTLKGKIAVYF